MFARFFVDRPVFATVLSIAIVLIGGVAFLSLPVAQYPEVTPPTISVTASYPGASAKVVAETVAAPIEQEVNGVENMLYMLSKCTNDGQMTLDITFDLGADLNMAQVLVQNRVAIAEAKLPDEVKRQGVTTKKRSPSILLAVNLVAPEGTRDQLYLSNFATTQVKDALARLKGVGDVTFLGARDYSMRVWLDPDRLAARDMTAGDVAAALQEQNIQVAAGRIGQPPVPAGQDFQLAINTMGRLLEPDQFSQIIVKTGLDGQITRLHDVGRTELGAKNYDVSSYLDGMPAVTMAVFQLPGSNALETAASIYKEMDRLKASSVWAEGVEYRIAYDTTVFIDESVHEVYKTLIEAFVLVFVIVLLFLQDWRATLLPMIDVPVSLIGTFAVMLLMGFSLNNLSLFGLVLAIGIVVDDAIVVVENIERWMRKGLPPREATIKAMDEITGPVIAITLVLSSVFIPTAFIPGISGQFYRQFALTIATATIISAINAMTMAPARAVTLIKPHTPGHGKREALPGLGVALLAGLAAAHFLEDLVLDGLGWNLAQLAPEKAWGLWGGLFVAGAIAGRFASPVVNFVLVKFFDGFNWVFDLFTGGYGWVVRGVVRVSVLMLVVYGGLLWLTTVGFATVPVGFIPEQDKGYLVVNAQLPDGASLERTEAVMRQIDEIIRDIDGVAHTLSVPGYSIVTGTNLSNVGGMFVILDEFEHRKHDPSLSAPAILRRLYAGFAKITDAYVVAFGAPPVDGLGSTGGFKLQVQDRGDAGPEALQGAVQNVIATANEQPELNAVYSTFSASQPQLFVDIDRTKAKALGVSLSDLFNTLQTYLGSSYVNDFTRFGRNWQVYVQADSEYRLQTADIGRLKVRNIQGKMIPLSTMVQIRDVNGPAIVNRYQMFPSAEVAGGTAPGVSSGQALGLMERVARQELPSGFDFEWTELSLLQQKAGNTGVFVFGLGTVFVLLVLSAQYESWSLPIAIILIVPMCLLAAISGVWIMQMDNNIFTQIGLVVLIGLAAKNAILIVEFAYAREREGMPRFEAAVDACKQRLRPILMTSFAFVLGVLPLAVATGAGAEMRRALGVAVVSGMLGVTLFGAIFTPVFYYVVRWTVDRFGSKGNPAGEAGHPAVTGH